MRTHYWLGKNPPSDKFELQVRQFTPAVGMQPYPQENPADNMLIRCASTNLPPTSITRSAHSASTTTIPYGSPSSRLSINANDMFLCYFPNEGLA